MYQFKVASCPRDNHVWVSCRCGHQGIPTGIWIRRSETYVGCRIVDIHLSVGVFRCLLLKLPMKCGFATCLCIVVLAVCGDIQGLQAGSIDTQICATNDYMLTMLYRFDTTQTRTFAVHQERRFGPDGTCTIFHTRTTGCL